MSDYNSTLGKAAGLLGLKMCVCHLLTVRTRVMTSVYKRKEDTTIHPAIGTMFKVLLCGYGPSVEINGLLGVVSNSVENEPFWFAIFLMIGLTKQTTQNHIKLIWGYVLCRYLHALTYLLGVQPYRAFSFVGGLAMTLVGAVELIR
eukprot:TRINITY_DN26393_c0_g1_i1.p1 TRINITY_DN26393_c0_g1~~TRINITY_DN26393_c0_g1_i1.p1  ORF type:complete len:146 (+),score=28.12 TRINITY_DN26393_c0_g1_i1:84-521(+)